jgi:hypothetical protein
VVGPAAGELLREQIRNKPAEFRAAPPRLDPVPLQSLIPMKAAQYVINIFARDAEDTAAQVKRVINEPVSTKYVRSRGPVMAE